MTNITYLAKRLIRDQLGNPCGLQEIADRLNISYHTLRKQFPRQEGMTMTAYYRRQRMVCAEKLLQNPTLTISQIALKLGFSTATNFIRWFN